MSHALNIFDDIPEYHLEFDKYLNEIRRTSYDIRGPYVNNDSQIELVISNNILFVYNSYSNTAIVRLQKIKFKRGQNKLHGLLKDGYMPKTVKNVKHFIKLVHSFDYALNCSK